MRDWDERGNPRTDFSQDGCRISHALLRDAIGLIGGVRLQLADAKQIVQWHSAPSRLEQASFQQRLHVPPTIGNQIDVYALFHYSIDESVRFKKRLAVLAYA